jgi:hypothetical protein
VLNYASDAYVLVSLMVRNAETSWRPQETWYVLDLLDESWHQIHDAKSNIGHNATMISIASSSPNVALALILSDSTMTKLTLPMPPPPTTTITTTGDSPHRWLRIDDGKYTSLPSMVEKACLMSDGRVVISCNSEFCIFDPHVGGGSLTTVAFPSNMSTLHAMVAWPPYPSSSSASGGGCSDSTTTHGVYVLDHSNRTAFLDPNTRTWHPPGRFPSPPTTAKELHGRAMIALPSCILILGGRIGGTLVHSYSPTTCLWQCLPWQLPEPVQYASAFLSGPLLVVCGMKKTAVDRQTEKVEAVIWFCSNFNALSATPELGATWSRVTMPPATQALSAKACSLTDPLFL